MNQEQTKSAEPQDPADTTRSIYVSSVAIATVGFFVGVGLPCWLAFNLAWGAGLGAMCAFWGGPGFGVMLASARVSLRDEAHESKSSLATAAVERQRPWVTSPVS